MRLGSKRKLTNVVSAVCDFLGTFETRQPIENDREEERLGKQCFGLKVQHICSPSEKFREEEVGKGCFELTLFVTHVQNTSSL